MAVQVNWALGQSNPNFAGAALTGYDAGRKIGRQRQLDQALGAFGKNPEAAIAAATAVDPEVGEKLEALHVSRQKREIYGRLLGSGRIATQPVIPAPALGGPAEPPPGALTGNRRPSNPPALPVETVPSTVVPSTPVSAPPTRLLDPADFARAHPRTDGLVIDQDALRELYRLDAPEAMKVQRFVYDMNGEQFTDAARRGEGMALAAARLSSFPADQRASELAKIAPELIGYGLTNEMLARADLTDEGLERVYTIGQGLTRLIRTQQDERDFNARQADVEADNLRADRNTDSLISDRGARRSLIARGQNMTDARGRRGQDLASTDRRRGQDMLDRRAREGVGGKPKPVIAVQTPEQARALKPGTLFRTPDGQVKVR